MLASTGRTTCGGLSRRSLLAAGAAVVAPLVARAQTGLERELIFSARGGSLGEGFRNKIIPPFEAKYGCKVTMVINDSGPALAKVVAERANPQADVLWTVEPTHAEGMARGVFAPLDLDRIPNYAKLYDFAKLPGGLGVYWGVGTTVLGYNETIFSQRKIAPPQGWGDLIVPATQGHVAWLDLSTQQGLNTFLMVNRHLGGTQENVDPVFKFLKENISNVLPITSPAQVDDVMQQKQAWVSTNLDARMWILKSKGFPVGIVYPSDGLPIQSGMVDVIKGAPHPNLANAFVDWLLSDEMQMVIGTVIRLGPVNKQVKLTPDVAAGLVYGEERVSKLVRFDYSQISKAMPGWLDRWNRELS